MIPQYTDWGGLKGSFDRLYAGIMAGTVDLDNLEAKLDEEQAALELLKVAE